jgi:hypothetical protein
VVARYRQRRRQTGLRVLRHRQQRTRNGVVNARGLTSQAALELWTVLAQVMPQPSQSTPVGGIKCGGE